MTIPIERMNGIRDSLRRYRRDWTFTRIVSDEEAFELVDLAAQALVDATLLKRSATD